MSVFGGKGASDSINSSCQKAGFLLKLPFRKQIGKWQRRWFVCKDGYMLYYGSKKLRHGQTKFDVHPKGVIPLGNTTVECYEPSTPPPQGYFTFRVTHPDFGSGALVLACESQRARMEWMAAIGDCGRITWENALLGDSMIERLKNKGTELEQEHESAMEKYKMEALKVSSQRESYERMAERAAAQEAELKRADAELQREQEEIEQLRLMTVESERRLQEAEAEANSLLEANTQAKAEAQRLEAEREQTSAALVEISEQANALEEQKALTELQLKETSAEAQRREQEAAERIQELEAAGEEIEVQVEQERARRIKAEKKLAAAQASLSHIEVVLRDSGGATAAEAKDVQNLKSFFEKRASDIKKQAALTQTIKKAVSAKKLYKKHSKRVSIEQNMVSMSGVAATLMADKWRKKTGSSTT